MKINSRLQRRYTFKGLCINLLVSSTVLMLFFVAVEMLLRTTHLFGARTSWSKPDRIIGYRYVSGSRYWFKGENDHPIVGQINRYGWRDKEWSLKKPHDTYRIAVLGDSYVEAFQVESESTFLALVESRMKANGNRRVEMMNFGRSGFTQTEELLLLKDDVRRFSPDLVILFFFPGNDIAEVSPATAGGLQRPFYHESANGKLTLDTSFVEAFAFKARYPLTWLKQRSALINLIYERHKYWHLKRAAARYSGGQNRLSGTVSLCTSNPNETFLKNYRLVKRLVRAIVEYCADNDIQFMLVTTSTRAYLPQFEERYYAIDSTFNPNFFEDDMDRYAESLGVEHVGMQRIFNEHYKTTENALHWTHWNYEGHKLVADILSCKLMSMIHWSVGEKGE